MGELREGADRSTGLVREFTGLAAAEQTAPVLVVDRPGWVRANAFGFATMMTPVIDKLASKKDAPGPISNAIGSRITGAEITDAARIRDIEQQLSHVLSKPDNAAMMTVTRRAPRQVRMFTTATQVTFSEDPVNGRTIIEIIAGDRPGLLSQVAQVFMAEDVRIYTSKIMTVGERAEDVFYVNDGSGGPLSSVAKERLSQRIIETLDRRV